MKNYANHINILLHNFLAYLKVLAFQNLFEESNIANDEDCVSDDDIITIISKQIKTRKESILEFRKGNRDDLISKTNSEIEILERYMPEMLSESEVENEVDSAINEVGATTIKDMGSVMKVLSSKLKGRADMTLVSSIIKNKLK